MATYSRILTRKDSIDKRSLVDYSLGGHKEMDMTEHTRTCTLKISDGPDPAHTL